MINILKLRKLEKENKEEVKNETSKNENPEILSEEKQTAVKKKNVKSTTQKKEKSLNSSKRKKSVQVEANGLEPALTEDSTTSVEENSADKKIEEKIVITESAIQDVMKEFSEVNLNEKIESIIETNSQESEQTDDPEEKLRLSLLNELLAESKESIKASEQKEKVVEETEVKVDVINPVVKEETIEVKQKASSNLETESEKSNSDSEKQKAVSESIIHLVGFNLANEYYGVEIMKIREIIRMTEITKVPKAPNFIEGVINLRGSVIPVINLRTKIKMPRKEYDKSTRIIVIELQNTVIGFIVDSVREVLRIPEKLLSPPPEFTVNKNSDYITAVAQLEDSLLILMDPEKILNESENKAIK